MFGFLGTGDAEVIVSIIASVTALLLGGWRISHKQKQLDTKLETINRAVNHVGPDEDTLIDKVRQMQVSMEETNTAAVQSRDYLIVCVSLLAHQVGVVLPPVPVVKENS
jgi:phosphoribosylformylglycinamidine (FGAM) synthase PurS component